MASQLEADLFENSDGENTEQFVDTAHQYLLDYVDKEIAKSLVLLASLEMTRTQTF